MPKSSGKQSRSPRPASKSRADPDIDLKSDKIKITSFSESKDWESTVFELKLLLRQAWKDPSLDIIKYLTDERYALSESATPAAAKAEANQLIYYILSVGSVRGSFARNAIKLPNPPQHNRTSKTMKDSSFSITSITLSSQLRITKQAFHRLNKAFTPFDKKPKNLHLNSLHELIWQYLLLQNLASPCQKTHGYLLSLKDLKPNLKILNKGSCSNAPVMTPLST
jgi:hypothetical protein